MKRRVPDNDCPECMGRLVTDDTTGEVYCERAPEHFRVPTENPRYPQLSWDAPKVPKGLRPRPGVECGCGMATCSDCYEPIPAAILGSIANPLR